MSSHLPALLRPDAMEWIQSRIAFGAKKYGAPVRIGWTRARQALMEELADAIVYAVALGDYDLVDGLSAMLNAQMKARP